ncbi:MAG: Hpt domain-containing protein [Candidatus Competibacteraceae bacterium]
MTGLQQACAYLYTNLLELAAQDGPLHPEQQRVVGAWPALALSYLRAPDDRSTCEALTRHLQETHWPQPLAAADATALSDLLLAPKLVTEEAEVEARPQQAQPSDVSLELPADVNQDLLDGLLQELPQQAADFSTAIQRLAAGDGQLADVEVARRIAHTLKGAGNTVGVRGIATPDPPHGRYPASTLQARCAAQPAAGRYPAQRRRLPGNHERGAAGHERAAAAGADRAANRAGLGQPHRPGGSARQ